LTSPTTSCTSKLSWLALAISSRRKKIGLSPAKSLTCSTWASRLLSSARGFKFSGLTLLSYTSAVTVAIDATPLTVPTGGVARYTLELARALAEHYPDDQYWMLSDQHFELPAGLPANLGTGTGPRNSVEKRWWLWGLPQELARRKADVFHGTDF